MKQVNSIQTKYTAEVQPEWQKKAHAPNIMAVPKITKVVVNMGVGYAKENDKERDIAISELQMITGQAPVRTLARKAIAGFGIREGMEVGAKVTLRGQRMFQFLDKIFNYVLPQMRDFRGLPERGFDGHGNYTFGLEDQMVFLEIDPNKTNRRRGLQVTIVTTAKDNVEARQLLVELGLPLSKGEEE